MFVYTAKKASHGAIPQNQFAQRGIEGYTVGPLSECGVMGITTQPIVTYSVYKNHIASFVAATAAKSVLQLGPYHGFNVYPVADMFDLLPKPDFVFALSDKIKIPGGDAGEKKKDEILAKLQITDPTMTKQMQYMKITMKNASWDQLRKIRNAMAMEAPVATISELNIYYADSYYILLQVVTAFLATNTYPSFADDDAEMAEPTGRANWNEMLEIPTTFVMEGKSLIELLKVPERVHAQTWLRQSGRITFEEQVTKVRDEDVVRVAKPSSVPWQANVGSCSAVPNMPGICFPYFHGLFTGDKISLFKLFTSRFLGVLGTSIDAIESAVDRLRRDLDRGSGMELHNQLSHIYFLINLALETQTRLFIIIQENKYMGACLLGGRFKIFNGIKWVGPATAEELQESLSMLSTHSNAVEEILRIIAEFQFDDSPVITEDDSARAIASSWHLVYLLQRMSWMQVSQNEDAMKRLLRYVSLLQYGARYKDISVANVTWAMKHMTTNNPQIEPCHVYLPPVKDVLQLVINTNRGKLLAAFGPHTFSFFSAKGQKYLLPTPPDVIPPNDAPLYAASEGPENLYIFRKPLAVALSELEYLRDGTKASYITVGSLAKERAVEQRKATIARGLDTVVIWNELVKFHYPKRIEQARPKRKQGDLYADDEEEDEEEPDAKRLAYDNLVL